MVMRSLSRCSTGAALDSQLWMVPLSLFATDRRHYTWLRRMSEQLCQFSREAVYTGLKKMEGLAPHPWTVMQPTGQSFKWMRECVGGGRIPSPFPLHTMHSRPSLCVFYYCRRPITKLFAWGGRRLRHVLRETTSRGLCGLVCPSRTSERGG